MSKPPLIKNPTKTAVYLPQETLAKGKSIAADTKQSLSGLITNLIDTQADSTQKVRVYADFLASEHDEIKAAAAKLGMTVEDYIKTATYAQLDHE